MAEMVSRPFDYCTTLKDTTNTISFKEILKQATNTSTSFIKK